MGKTASDNNATNLKGSKLLVIVESPTKAGHIKDYLQKAGYNARVMASVGHIMELANGGSYYNSGVDPDKDFALNLKVSDDKKDVVRKLKEQVDWADKVYLMSDPDREGEVISWSLVKFLKLPKGKYVRAVTHEITPKAVLAAIENPGAINESMVDAGLARMTLDKMIGFRLSPISKTYVGAKSVGRCQSVGLKIIADREKEIQNFKPETYFDLYLTFEKKKEKFKAKFAGDHALGNIDHLATQAAVDKVKKACVGDYVVEDVHRRDKEESPKPPFCTATFQQEAASKIGLKIKDAMSIAQKLFESGHITYMRTDDTAFAPEFLPALKSYISEEYGEKAYTKPRVAKKSDTDQSGHECLRVTNLKLTPEAYAEQYGANLNAKVYKLIWQRTVAAAMPNAVISETQYLIDNSGEKFILTSNEVRSQGYREVYSYKDDDDKEEGPVKETFSIGEKLSNTALSDVKKETKPAPRFTEATLSKKLQTEGVGRPSTYATIVETVLSTARGYATLDGKSIVPTDRGMQLAAFLDRAFSNIINLKYTKDMEDDLDKIATGKSTKTKFLTEFYGALEGAISASPELKSARSDNAPQCPICGAQMVMRRSRYGKLFYGCSKYPSCTGIVNAK